MGATDSSLRAFYRDMTVPERRTFWACFWGWLLVWRRVAWDNSFLRKFRAGRRVLALRTKDNAVVYSRGRGVALAPQEPHPVQLDGDEFGEAKHVQTRIDPRGLIVAVPAGHTLPGD